LIRDLLKTAVLGAFLGLGASPVLAEELFWAFTDDQEPLPIPAECDARFDEVRGGVFVPSPEEVYDYGVEFLNSDIETVRRQAPYCFLLAAFAGNNQAQLELARMYSEGKYLPQDDLSAYKWSFISALDGNKNAERFALTLEQFLTNSDLSQTNAAILDTRGKIEQAKKAKEDAAKAAEGEEEQQQAPTPEGQTNAEGGEKEGVVAPNSLLPIFNDEDRLK